MSVQFVKKSQKAIGFPFMGSSLFPPSGCSNLRSDDPSLTLLSQLFAQWLWKLAHQCWSPSLRPAEKRLILICIQTHLVDQTVVSKQPADGG